MHPAPISQNNGDKKGNVQDNLVSAVGYPFKSQQGSDVFKYL